MQWLNEILIQREYPCISVSVKVTIKILMNKSSGDSNGCNVISLIPVVSSVMWYWSK